MPVLLGVKDSPILKTVETSPTLNKIGGKADHFCESLFSSPLECPECKNPMYLVVQLYCPLNQSNYHRTLYIYSCVNRKCWGNSSSWKVVREQKLDKTATCDASTCIDTQKDVWGTADDDWGDDEEELELDQTCGEHKVMESDDVEKVGMMMGENLSLNPSKPEMSSFENQKQSKSCSPHEMETVHMEETLPLTQETVSRMLQLMAPSKAGDETPINKAGLNSYYLNVFEESEEPHALSTQHAKTLLENYSRNEGKTFQNMLNSVRCSERLSGNMEEYEKDDVKYNDESFYKFHKTVSRWPEQCVRYELGGMALPLTTEPFQAEVCSSCGSERHFELQLMPALVSALTFPNSKDYAVEFGTVLVFTCSQSCWDENETSKSEVCFVQCEKEQFLLQ